MEPPQAVGNGHLGAGQCLAQQARQLRGPRLTENPADAADDAGIQREASRGAGDDDHAFLVHVHVHVHVHGGGRGKPVRRESTGHFPRAFDTFDPAAAVSSRAVDNRVRALDAL
ncbi:hypothetical protein [Streptomyces malaysiensis]|uniref:hypothetical protein n=1 Tax=Streptomyces malaysiensis TaxID=92644 RepID=UPI0016519DA6|nr:hypothetical protein [Streptomyces malaysiensis]